MLYQAFLNSPRCALPLDYDDHRVASADEDTFKLPDSVLGKSTKKRLEMRRALYRMRCQRKLAYLRDFSYVRSRFARCQILSCLELEESANLKQQCDLSAVFRARIRPDLRIFYIHWLCGCGHRDPLTPIRGLPP